jgi:hypothetical protein
LKHLLLFRHHFLSPSPSPLSAFSGPFSCAIGVECFWMSELQLRVVILEFFKGRN